MGLPQRENRPSLDISPEASIPETAGWQDDYGDVGMNPLNHPVPVRKGSAAANGWTQEPFSVYPNPSGSKIPDPA